MYFDRGEEVSNQVSYSLQESVVLYGYELISGDLVID